MESNPNQVTFETYMPDGPGYAGPVIVTLQGQRLALSAGDEDGPVVDFLSTEMPQIADSRLPDNVQLRDIYDTLDQEAREYLQGSAANLDPSRVRWLRFTNGVEGALLLWGECTQVTIMVFDPAGRRCETLDVAAAHNQVRDVVDDVLDRGQKYGFQQDEDSVREAVDESAGLLSIELTELQAQHACSLVMQEQER